MSEEFEFIGIDTITISKKEHERLLDREDFLSALEEAGVNNWNGYSDAWEIYRGYKEE